jgi:hypothetical protein
VTATLWTGVAVCVERRGVSLNRVRKAVHGCQCPVNKTATAGSTATA